MKESIYTLNKDNVHMFRLLFPEDIVSFFGDDKVGFGVMCDDTPAALLLASFTDDVLWLDWLYVKEEYRGTGVSIRLLNAFYKNMSGLVSDNIVYTACENPEVQYVLTKTGFEFDSEAAQFTFRSTLSGLNSVPEHKPDKAVTLLNKLDQAALANLNREIVNSGVLGVALPVDPADYMRESLVYTDGDKIKAMLLLKEHGDVIDVAYAWVAGGEEKALIHLISAAKVLLQNTHSEDTEISMTTLNEASKKLASHLFPKSECTQVFKGSMSLMGF